MIPYEREPAVIQQGPCRPIAHFTAKGGNLDPATVQAFGEEWERFHHFSDDEIQAIASEYFDIVPESDWTHFKQALDLGCGSGRWSRFLAPKVGYLDAVDPSNAVLVADKNLEAFENVRVTRSDLDSLPFKEGSFDFVLCLGVLHHMPQTEKAVADLCRFLKPGGKLLCYLYYDISHRGALFRTAFSITAGLRSVISRLPRSLRNLACDVLALTLYAPLVGLQKILGACGVNTSRWPLSYYRNKSWHVMRNDARDRFGTPLEQRFTREEISAMLKKAGMTAVVFSENAPFWHCYATKT